MKTDFLVVAFDEIYAQKIIQVRRAVFTLEQQIDDKEDLDGNDPGAIHILAVNNGQYVGTGRILADGRIGRLAVLKTFRHQGIGTHIINLLISEARQMEIHSVFLGAQVSALAFYQKLGFEEYGQPYDEVGIEHHHMRLDLV